MATRVSCPHNGWYVIESVDEIEALIDPPAKPLGDAPPTSSGIQWMTIEHTPRFVTLTIDPAYLGGRQKRTVRVAVAHIIAIEEVPS